MDLTIPKLTDKQIKEVKLQIQEYPKKITISKNKSFRKRKARKKAPQKPKVQRKPTVKKGRKPKVSKPKEEENIVNKDVPLLDSSNTQIQLEGGETPPLLTF